MLIPFRLNLYLQRPNVLIQWNNCNNEKCKGWDRPMREETRKEKGNWEKLGR